MLPRSFTSQLCSWSESKRKIRTGGKEGIRYLEKYSNTHNLFEKIKSVLERLSESLGMTEFSFEKAVGSFGNAILSKIKILRSSSITFYTHAENRCALICELDFKLDKGPIYIICTHLDHEFEQIRLQQLEQLFNFLHTEGLSNKPHIIMGDFNALSSHQHYSKQKIEEISVTRKSGFWEAPVFEVYSQMLKKGYLDCWNGKVDEGTCRWVAKKEIFFW